MDEAHETNVAEEKADKDFVVNDEKAEEEAAAAGMHHASAA